HRSAATAPPGSSLELTRLPGAPPWRDCIMFGPESFADGGVALLQPPAARRANPADLAERALRNSPYLALRNVDCDCHDGGLTLRGRVPTYYLKQVAQAAAARVEGVRQVVNEIEVLCGGMHEMRRT